MTPLLAMYSLGHNFIPAPIHAGGLRYHGMAPLVSAALRDGLMEAQAIHQSECFEAGLLFSKTEGIIPAPETNHAIAVAIREALKAKGRRKRKSDSFQLQRSWFDGFGWIQQIPERRIK
jgi:tryptophan synthase beta chain